MGLPARHPHSGRGIRVLIVDDHPVVRDGLGALLATQADLILVGAAHDGSEALRLARELEPDVILLDYSMPGMSGLDVMREMKRLEIAGRAIVLTAAIDQSDVGALLQFGIRGIVRKDAPMELIFKSIRKVHEGELWVDRETMGTVVKALAAPREAGAERADRPFALTPREREVLQLVVEGETNRRIAARLSVGEDTVKHHLTSIFNKTGASNRLELALFALHHRLIQRQ